MSRHDIPVIDITTQEWQRAKLGPSVKRDLKWFEVSIKQLTVLYRESLAPLNELNNHMAKFAEVLKNRSKT